MAGVKDQVLKPLGHQQIANPAASTALTVPDGASYAFLNCTAGTAIRMRGDAGAPTASLGCRLAAGDKLWWNGDLRSIRVIQETTGTLDVEYFA